MCVLFRRQNF